MSLEAIGPRPVHNGDEEAALRKLLRVKRATFGVAVVILVVVIVGFGIGIWAILQQSQDNHALAEQIRSCTDPAGECYQDQQRRTADLVGEPHGPINTVTVLAIACADKPGQQTDDEIFACVIRELQARADERSHP